MPEDATTTCDLEQPELSCLESCAQLRLNGSESYVCMYVCIYTYNDDSNHNNNNDNHNNGNNHSEINSGNIT